ncbi:MAG: hypothetical protein ACJ74R_11275 [Gaiellaceae bacterium]
MRFAAALAVVATIASGTAVGATTRARVAVTSTDPMTVVGSGFRSRERVTVTVMTTGIHRKVVTAGAKGGFTAKFAGATIGYCESYFVRAKGNRGSLAILKVIPECPSSGPSG